MRMNKFLKDSLITFVSRAASMVIALGSNIIISRLLGPSLKGSYNLTLLVINVTALLITFGLGPANVYYGARKPVEVPTLLGNSILAATLLGLSGIIAGELVTFLPPFKNYLINNGVYINWLRGLILFLPLVLLKFYLPDLIRAAGKIFKYNLIGLWDTISGLAATIILVWFLNLGLNGAIATWMISIISVLFFIGLLLSQISSNQINIDTKMLRRNIAFGVRLYPGHIAQFLNYRIDVFLVAFFLSPREIGFYVTATVIVEKLWEIPHAIRTILLYRVAAYNSNSTLITTACISRIIIFFLGGLCTILAFLSYPLINLLFGVAFLPAASAMIFLLPGVWLLGLAKLLVTYLMGIGKPEVGSFAAIISLIATIILDLMLIPKLGIIGASIASSCAYLVSFSVILIKFLQVTKLSLREITILKREDLSLLYNSVVSLLNNFSLPLKKQDENNVWKN
jgi:O-antigen/teichoic acid export membrane protein